MNRVYDSSYTPLTSIPEGNSSARLDNGYAQRRHGIGSTIPQAAKITGLVIALSISPMTAIADPWLAEDRRRNAGVTKSSYEAVSGRRLSRAEALQIAQRILERAEYERLNAVEYEAARGIQWVDEQ